MSPEELSAIATFGFGSSVHLHAQHEYCKIKDQKLIQDAYYFYSKEHPMLSDETVQSVAEALQNGSKNSPAGFYLGDILAKDAITAVLASKEVRALVDALELAKLATREIGKRDYDVDFDLANKADSAIDLALAPFLVDSGESVG